METKVEWTSVLHLFLSGDNMSVLFAAFSAAPTYAKTINYCCSQVKNRKHLIIGEANKANNLTEQHFLSQTHSGRYSKCIHFCHLALRNQGLAVICLHFHRCSVTWRPEVAVGRCCSIGETAPLTSTAGGGNTKWWVQQRAGSGCIVISKGSMDQCCRTGQEVPITIHGWFGMERRGIPASLWSQVTCGCCVWPPSCSLPPPMLLHLLSLPLPVVLPHTHIHTLMHKHTHHALQRATEHYCLNTSLRSQLSTAGKLACGDESNTISK